MQKAYYTNPQKAEFCCKIEEKITLNDKTYYLFDIFPFYPGGGGEEADFGYADQKKLDECLENGEKVYYSFSEDIGNVGDEVNCWADIPLRKQRSVMHTSQHILSAIFADVFSLATDSVHFSDTYAAIDLSGEEITDDNLRYVQTRANEIVRSCIDVDWQIVEPSELKNYSLRKTIGEVDFPRIVTIPGVDQSLCCAVHVGNTGNIGIIKIIRAERKAGSLRVTFTAGQAALDDYTLKSEAVRLINAHLSSTVENIYERVLKKDEDIASLKKQLAGVREELMNYELDKFLLSNLKVITKEGNVDELKKLGATLIQKSQKAFIGIDRDESKIIIYQNIDRPVNSAINILKENFDIKGGGNANSGQVMVFGNIVDVVNFLIAHFEPIDAMEGMNNMNM